LAVHQADASKPVSPRSPENAFRASFTGCSMTSLS